MDDLTIVRTDNGYVASWWEEDSEGETVKHGMSFEETNTEGGEVECFARLLDYITEHFGMIGSKHDKHRIRITTEKGDEYA